VQHCTKVILMIMLFLPRAEHSGWRQNWSIFDYAMCVLHLLHFVCNHGECISLKSKKNAFRKREEVIPSIV
jgi:hypothetical protein